MAGPPTAVAAGPDAVWVASEADDVVIRIDPRTSRIMGQEDACDGPSDIVVIGVTSVVTCPVDHAVWRISSDGEPIQTEIEGLPVGVGALGDEAWVTVRES